MGTTIRIKRSLTTGQVPSTLQEGELAVNIIDKKMWIGDDNTAAVLILDYNSSLGGGGGSSTEEIQDAAASLFIGGTHTGISVSYPDTNNALNLTNTGVLSFNSRTGSVTLSSTDVTTAVGNGSVISTTYGGTGISTFTAGDLLYYSAGTTLTKLAIGTANRVLTSDGSVPVWTANTGTGSVVRASSPTILSPSINTITCSTSAVSLWNTTATTLTALGSCTSLTIGSSAGTTNLVTNNNILGSNNVGGGSSVSISTNSATLANPLTISPYGQLTLSTNKALSLGSLPSIVVENTENGYVKISGGDLYIGTKEDGFQNITSSVLIFEGTTADGFETTLTLVDPTADRTITLPDVTGTVITSGNLTSITSTGTISSGTWNGTAISTSYGGTGLTTYTAGDLLYYSTGTSLTKLGIGTSGQVLTSSGSAPQWSTPEQQVGSILSLYTQGVI